MGMLYNNLNECLLKNGVVEAEIEKRLERVEKEIN